MFKISRFPKKKKFPAPLQHLVASTRHAAVNIKSWQVRITCARYVIIDMRAPRLHSP